MKSALTTLALLALASTAPAALVTGSWIDRLGNGMVLSGANTASPTMGDGTADNADGQSLYSPIGSTVTLSSAGDKVTLSGSATLVGITAAGNQFRWGLYNTNGSGDDTGWLGYFASNGSGASGGPLFERVSGDTNWFMTTGVNRTETVATATAPATNLTNSDYNFLLSLELVAGGLQIESSLVRTSDSQEFASISFLDPTISTTSFDRVGFLSGGSLNADQIAFTDVDVTYIPEPSAGLLGALGAIALIRRRRA